MLVVGGSRGLTGAPMLAALAAFRADAGYVAVAAPESTLPVLEARLLEVVKRPLPEDSAGRLLPRAADAILEAAEKADAVAIGPGLGRSDGTVELVRILLERSTLPVVLDADALWELEPFARARADRADAAHRRARAPARQRRAPRSTRTGSTSVRRAASRFGAVVLLKGADTLVAAPREGVLVATYGTPALATAGSGDVLTGVVAAFLAKGMDAQLAAATAAVAHGVAAELVEPQRGVIASDLLPELQTRARRARPAARAARLMRSEITIDLGALRRNVKTLLRALDGAELWAVVKADAYGHGAVDCAGAALDAGATALCVATVPEALVLRAGAADGADPRARAGVEPRGRRRRATPGSSSSSRATTSRRACACTSSSTPGMGRWGAVGAAVADARGRRRDDASRDRRQRPRLRARADRALPRGDRAARAPDAPRGEQRRGAAAARVALRRRALRDRALRALAVRRPTPAEDGLEPVLSLDDARSRSRGCCARASRRDTGGGSSPSATRGSGSCPSATRTASAAT